MILSIDENLLMYIIVCVLWSILKTKTMRDIYNWESMMEEPMVLFLTVNAFLFNIALAPISILYTIIADTMNSKRWI